MPVSHEDEEEALQESEIPVIPEEEMFSMTRSKFKDLMAKALEDKKNLADATSDEAIKSAFMKGVKYRSEMQTQTIHSSPMDTETIHQNPIAPNDENVLNAIHQLRPTTSVAMAPSTVNYAMPSNSQRIYQHSQLTMEIVMVIKLYRQWLASVRERDTREKQISSSLMAL